MLASPKEKMAITPVVLSVPTPKPNDPPTTVLSEFLLASRVPDLVSQIHQDFVAPCRAAVAAHLEKYQSMRQNIEREYRERRAELNTTWRSTLRQFEEQLSSIERTRELATAELARVKEETDRLTQISRSYYERVSQHCRGLHFSTPDLDLGEGTEPSESLPKDPKLFPAAMADLRAELDRNVAALEAIPSDRNPLWPSNAPLRIGMLIGAGVAGLTMAGWTTSTFVGWLLAASLTSLLIYLGVVTLLFCIKRKRGSSRMGHVFSVLRRGYAFNEHWLGVLETIEDEQQALIVHQGLKQFKGDAEALFTRAIAHAAKLRANTSPPTDEKISVDSKNPEELDISKQVEEFRVAMEQIVVEVEQIPIDRNPLFFSNPSWRKAAIVGSLGGGLILGVCTFKSMGGFWLAMGGVSLLIYLVVMVLAYLSKRVNASGCASRLRAVAHRAQRTVRPWLPVNQACMAKEEAEALRKDRIVAEGIRTGQEKRDALLEKEDTQKRSALQNIDNASQADQAKLSEEFSPQASRWQNEFKNFRAQCASAGSDWSDSAWSDWRPDDSPEFAARVGRLISPTSDLEKLFADPVFRFELPALIPFSEPRCLMLQSDGPGHPCAAAAVQSLLLRALANTPPGKMRFTFLDPIGLGQNVAMFMPLGKENEALIHGRAWTEAHHIEQRLSELTEHMETVIQKYLQGQYANILAYNRSAGEIAEPYRVLVVMDFPANFSDSSVRRLLSIIRHGPKCGVFTVLLADRNKPLPYGMDWSELERSALVIKVGGDGATWNQEELRDWGLVLDRPPEIGLFSKIISTAGESAKSAMKVEVPFEKLLSRAGMDRANWWKGNASSGIRVPLGPTGARDIQHLAFGEGSAHHGLIVGRTGSGKTNLMHVAIASMALKYSPEEVQLYLIDFKGGVGFKVYAEHQLPHAAAIAIESDREFGMSLLDKLEVEMKERSELFRANGVPDIAAYRSKTGKKLPRILLLVDEFQEFFCEDDEMSQRARQLFERLVRQGRGFGIHILLGTQSLSGSATLPDSTFGQIAVRIVLQCAEADAIAMLAPDNKEARLLSRPGEAVYNSAAGLIEGNSRLQAALLSDDVLRIHLQAIRSLATSNGDGHAVPIVFEGDAPAQLSECKPLLDLISNPHWPTETRVIPLWLGEPVSLRPTVKANLPRQTGRHLLAVVRDEAEGLGVLIAAWVSLLVQHRPTTARFYVLNLVTSDGPWAGLADQMAEWFPHQIEMLTRRTLVPRLTEWTERIKQRQEHDHKMPKATEGRDYLIVLGLHRAKDLKEDELRSYASDSSAQPSAAELFAAIVRDGPEAGIHVLAWSDTYPNAMRILGRSTSEFGIRIAGPMSGEDSRSFIDETVAGRLDRPHRAYLADEERPGALDKFRPYAIPPKEWLCDLGKKLGRR